MSHKPWHAKLWSYLTWRTDRAIRAPARMANALFGTLWYDLVIAGRKRVYPGSVPDSARVALYLIYPLHGVQASHHQALAHFRAQGYAPIVISNLPLAPKDREALLGLANHLIERPNYGYDFGGYRDGVLFLREHLHTLERLVLTNDSVWFPMAPEMTWIQAAETLGRDVVGAAPNYFCDPSSLAGVLADAAPWRYDTEYPQFHYCSFALMFGSAVLKDQRFLAFWRRFKLSSNKLDTVIRGELGLGQWIVHSGHSHGCTWDIANLDADLERLDNHQLRQVAEGLTIPEDPALREQKKAVLALTTGAPDEKQRLKHFILWATAATGPAYAMPGFAVKTKGFDFLKKSPMWLDADSASITLALLQNLGNQAFVDEAKALREQRAGAPGMASFRR